MSETRAVPNLFDFATGELSQDAFLAWLANWADPKYAAQDPALNEVAQAFISRLSAGAFTGVDIASVKTRQQFKKTDVVIAVTLCAPRRENHLIVIEDKTSSGIHGDQLREYTKRIGEAVSVGGEFESHIPHFVYYKTEDHITSEKDLGGFTNITRADALAVFNAPAAKAITNAIFTDYVSRLNRIENDSKAYRHRPVEDWEYAQWSGFLKALCEALGADANFGYVPNASGGFIAAWFGWDAFTGAVFPEMIADDEIYLQLARRNTDLFFDLKVRVASPDRARTLELKASILPRLTAKLEAANIAFSSRNIRSGKSMAIMTLEGVGIAAGEDKAETLAADIRHIISVMSA
ncbi:MAG: hypothetical protein ACPGVT_07845 [Maricaulaceae bacterium]